MNDVSDLESGKANFSDPLYFIVEFIPFQILLGANVRKDAVALAPCRCKRFRRFAGR
jgi:hypothetical protein